jgi:hypothetical protein
LGIETPCGVTEDNIASPSARNNIQKRVARRHRGAKAFFGRYGFARVTGSLLLFPPTGHWIFGWYAYVNEHIPHSQPIEVGAYFIEKAS